MSSSSDLDVLIALETLNEIINDAIDKADNLLQEAWDNEDLKQIKEEISQAKQELQQAESVLEASQKRSTLTLQELNSISSSASKQKDLLEQTHNASTNLYSELKLETARGQDCLNSLIASIQESEQYEIQFNEAIRRIAAAENILAEIDRKHDFLVNLQNDIVEAIDRLGSNRSVEDLVIAIRESSQQLQQERDLIQNAIDQQTKPLKHRIDLLNDLVISLQKENQKLQQQQTLTRNAIDEQIEPLKRQIDRLIQAQSTPWWLPRNWWWKTRISFTAKSLRRQKNKSRSNI